MDSKQFEDICERVWSDRAAILRGRGRLSGDATLVRAVFWRLCKAGLKTRGCVDNDGSTPALLGYQLVVGRMLQTHGRPSFDAAAILKHLVDRYQIEAGESGKAEDPVRPDTPAVSLPGL